MPQEPEISKVVMPPMYDRDATLEIMKSLPDVTVYGLLLNANPKHPVAQAFTDHWPEFHHTTGSKAVLVAFSPPASWAEALKLEWRQRLGNRFEEAWNQWQSVDTGAALTYLDLFKNPPIDDSQLPCLVLFTDLNTCKAVVRSIPSWNADETYELLLAMMREIRACSELHFDESPERAAELRLEALRNALTSPRAIALDTLGHLKDRGVDYFKKNPAIAVVTTVSILVALSGAGVLPLGAGALTVLGIIKTVFGK